MSRLCKIVEKFNPFFLLNSPLTLSSPTRFQPAMVLPLPLLLIPFFLLSGATSIPLNNNRITVNCTGTAYAANTPYQTNLNTLLSSLVSESSSTNYNITTVGIGTNRIYGHFLCEGDLAHTDCQTCVQTATSNITAPESCPFYRQAIIWYDYCMVRYSDTNFFGVVDSNGFNRTNPGTYTNSPVPYEMVANLVQEAPFQRPMFAYNYNASTSMNLYAMAECTDDLTSAGCSQCLTAILSNIKLCCTHSRGWRYLSASCWIRYEDTPFLRILGSTFTQVVTSTCSADSLPSSNSLNTLLSDITSKAVALSLLVWVQTRSGMDVGFGVSAAAMAMGLGSLICGVLFYRNKPPQGSIFSPIARVFVAAIAKRKQQVCPSNAEMLHRNQSYSSNRILNGGPESSSNNGNLLHISKFSFLDKASIRIQDGSRTKESPWKLCTTTEVEQVKVILSVIPIFACTIIFNTILAQLQTFSVQQGSSMDTRLTASFKTPPASLQAIPYLMLIILVPLYETAFVPIARRLTGIPSGITPLQRIGIGLFTVTFSMVVAALVEKWRRETAVGSHELLSIFWIAPQFLVFGLSEMFTAVGLIEFFYKQSLAGMQSFLTAMTYCSYSFGFYLSSLLVSLVNKITSGSSEGGWLSENDLNKDRLDLFYWVLAALSILNFVNYLFWANWYSYNPSVQPINTQQGGVEQVSFRSSKNGGSENVLPR